MLQYHLECEYTQSMAPTAQDDILQLCMYAHKTRSYCLSWKWWTAGTTEVKHSCVSQHSVHWQGNLINGGQSHQFAPLPPLNTPLAGQSHQWRAISSICPPFPPPPPPKYATGRAISSICPPPHIHIRGRRGLGLT